MKYLNPDGSEIDPTRDDWKSGFTQGSHGLWCDLCRALVRQSPGDTAAHLEWHAKLGG